MRSVLLCIALIFAMSTASWHARSAWAATDAPAEAPAGNELSKDDLKRLEKTLRDPAARQELIDNIHTMITLRDASGAQGTAEEAPPGLGDRLINFLSGGVRGVADALSAGKHQVLISNAINWASTIATDPQRRLATLETIGAVLGVLLAAWAVESVITLVSGRAVARLRRAPKASIPAEALRVAAEILLGWLSVAGFIVAGYACLVGVMAVEPRLTGAKAVALAILEAHALTRGLAVIVTTARARP
ncbi:hypothetical protein, partial [Azospirillum sp. B4]|uniref:hypothetical protein n=1 Tax=Azospirillum sp. B4 TaxID=95605 RepID=UPI0011DE10CA